MSVSNSTSFAFSSSDRALGANSMRVLPMFGARAAVNDRFCSRQMSAGGEELDLRRCCQRGLFRAQQLLRLPVIVLGERPSGRAELHHDAVRVVGVDRRAPAVVDLRDVVAMTQPPLFARFQVGEVA